MDEKQTVPYSDQGAMVTPPSQDYHQSQSPLPPRPNTTDDFPPYNPADFESPTNPTSQQSTTFGQPNPSTTQTFLPPPQRISHTRSHSGAEPITSPIHYTRDPHKLTAYLVPFPAPKLHNTPTDGVPTRFLIYTPPPPPLHQPSEGEKESKVHKVQRKWQAEIRAAKTSDAKTASWKGVKSKVTKGIDWGMSQTKTSNLDFLNRIGGNPAPGDKQQSAGGEGSESDEKPQPVKLEEMLLVYPASMSTSPEQIRQEFVNTMLRSKSRAERDAVIATGLLPVAAAVDIMATLIWPFGGLLEIDAVWAFASIRGAKTSRSVTKRLASTSTTSAAITDESAVAKKEEDTLHLNFTPSPRLDVLQRYLAARCHERDGAMFPFVAAPPTETEVLEAMGWTPSSKVPGASGLEDRNWEDEQWEISEAKDDLRDVMGKGAKEWVKWCKLFEKQPEKAMKK